MQQAQRRARVENIAYVPRMTTVAMKPAAVLDDISTTNPVAGGSPTIIMTRVQGENHYCAYQ